MDERLDPDDCLSSGSKLADLSSGTLQLSRMWSGVVASSMSGATVS